MTAAEHARLGATTFGGPWRGHMLVHEWVDQLAAQVRGPSHQMFLHNADLAPTLANLCLPSVEVGAGRMVHMSELVGLHLEQDFGWQPCLVDWLDALDLEQLPPYGDSSGLPGSAEFRLDPLQESAKRWGGRSENYQPLLALLDWPMRNTGHPAAPWIFHNTWGVSVVEAVLGPSLRLTDGATTSTRLVAQGMIRALSGTIVKADAVARALVIQPWMLGAPMRPVLSIPGCRY